MSNEDPASTAPAAPPAPPPPQPSEQIVTLTAHADVLGEQKPKGKVLRVPAAEAQRLIAAQQARPATALDQRIAGFI